MILELTTNADFVGAVIGLAIVVVGLVLGFAAMNDNGLIGVVIIIIAMAAATVFFALATGTSYVDFWPAYLHDVRYWLDSPRG